MHKIRIRTQATDGKAIQWQVGNCNIGQKMPAHAYRRGSTFARQLIDPIHEVRQNPVVCSNGLVSNIPPDQNLNLKTSPIQAYETMSYFIDTVS